MFVLEILGRFGVCVSECWCVGGAGDLGWFFFFFGPSTVAQRMIKHLRVIDSSVVLAVCPISCWGSFISVGCWGKIKWRHRLFPELLPCVSYWAHHLTCILCDLLSIPVRWELLTYFYLGGNWALALAGRWCQISRSFKSPYKLDLCFSNINVIWILSCLTKVTSETQFSA